MKKSSIIYLLPIISLCISCSSNNDEEKEPEVKRPYFTISAIKKSDNTIVNGGTYKLFGDGGKEIATYTLEKGIVKVFDLPTGNYTVEEIITPENYIPAEDFKKKMQISYASWNETEENYKEIEWLEDFLESRERAEPEPEKFIFSYNDAPPKTTELTYRNTQDDVNQKYTAVRIGEYYWINQNFNHIVPEGNNYENRHPISQETLNKYVERIRINISFFQLQDINDFEKHYGRYYSYGSTMYMNKYGYMENEKGENENGWKLPYAEEYRQLFAMSPFNTSFDEPHTALNERDVRFALSAKTGDNSLAHDITPSTNSPYKTYWFNHAYTTNMYRFNLMPGGARLNGSSQWCNGLGPAGGCYPDGTVGDIYLLFYTSYMATVKADNEFHIGPVIIHDNIDTDVPMSYHYLNVRWCRRLTDAELGYKLYINSDKTDIKKLYIDVPTPEGYKELPHGYLRGFYVQHILNKRNPTVTVKDIIDFSRSVEDNYVYFRQSDNDIIF